MRSLRTSARVTAWLTGTPMALATTAAPASSTPIRNGTTLNSTVISRPVDSRMKALASDVCPPERTERISHTSATAATWNNACQPATAASAPAGQAPTP
jgi:hypothetical protein